MRWILVLFCAILGGAIAGFGLYLLDKLGFYLVLLMPIFAGGVVGFITILPVLRSQVPTAPLVVFAILGCAVALGIYWYGQYTVYQDTVVEIVQGQDPSATREDALALIDAFNEDEYGATGFMGFVADYAATGVGIGDVGASESDLQLTNELAYGFFVVEALLMVGFAIVAVVRRKNNALAKRLAPEAA